MVFFEFLQKRMVFYLFCNGFSFLTGPSRLRGIFCLNPLLKTITKVPLGALRAHESFFFKSLIKNEWKLDPGSPSRLWGIFLLNPLLKLITNVPLGPLRVCGASSFETPYKRNKKETSKVHLQNHPFWINRYR